LWLIYVFNVHSYDQSNHDNIIFDPYFNNLLPWEKLVYQYNKDVYLEVNNTELIWSEYDEKEVLATCSKINELKLLDNGLYLICEKETKTIESLPSDKKYTLTIKCNLINEVLSSNNEEYNNLYSLSPAVKDEKTWLHLSNVGVLYGLFELELLDINDYLDIEDTIYSINLKNGDIIVNKGIALHREYHKKEDNYILKLINNDVTLVLISSRGEYKWCNNYINNRLIIRK